MLIKYIKSVLWRVAKRLSYIEDARCLKVNIILPSTPGSTKWSHSQQTTTAIINKLCHSRGLPADESTDSSRTDDTRPCVMDVDRAVHHVRQALQLTIGHAARAADCRRVESPRAKKNFVGTQRSIDRLCGLVVRVSGYRYRGLGFDSRRYQIF